MIVVQVMYTRSLNIQGKRIRSEDEVVPTCRTAELSCNSTTNPLCICTVESLGGYVAKLIRQYYKLDNSLT